MSKFKIGDKVRVREDLNFEERYPREDGIGLRCCKNMMKYRGKIATVVSVDIDGDYKLDIDYEKHYWTDAMLEPVKSKQIKIGEATTFTQITGSYNKIYQGSKLNINRHGKKSYVWYRNGNVVTCVVESGRHKGVGIAKCNPKDKFNYDKGCELAEARANINFHESIAKDLAREEI